MLADERDRLARAPAGDPGLRAVVEVSCRQLAAGDARLFRLLGLLPGPDFVAAVAACLGETGPEAAAAMLDRLALAALVTGPAAGRFAMHDLLRLLARQMCQEVDDQRSRDAVEGRLVGHYAELAEQLDACLDRAPGEAMAMFEAERAGLLAALGLAERRGWDRQVWRLCDAMGGPLERLRYLDDVLAVQRSALAAVRRAGIGIAAEGSALGNLGSAYLELRRFAEAIGCFRDALAIFWEVGDRRAEGMTLDGLGDAYGGLLRFAEAAACYQSALAIFRETGDRHREALTLTSLGAAYGGLRRYREEISCCQEALAIHRQAGGLGNLGLPLRNLGLAYYNLGRLKEAIACDEDALAIYRQSGDRHGEGLTLSNLGHAYREQDRPGQAAACWRDAAAAMRDAGDDEQAATLEHAAGAQERRR
jgi:tetratricopeptide (TPR) repeat protein